MSSLTKGLLAAAAVLAVLFFLGVLDWRYWRSWGRAQVAVAASSVGGGGTTSPARAGDHAAVCRANLRQLETAKRRAAEKAGVTRSDIPWSEVLPFLGGKRPSCPAGGTYSLGASTGLPKCSISNNRTTANADDHILDSF